MQSDKIRRRLLLSEIKLIKSSPNIQSGITKHQEHQEKKDGCFRHQLLLGRQTHSPNRETDRAAGASFINCVRLVLNSFLQNKLVSVLS